MSSSPAASSADRPSRSRRSAGLLLYRADADGLRMLLVHMGGPFWRGKDRRAWSVPKGEHGADEDPLAAARREFAEELGQPAPVGDYHYLGTARQAGGKVVAVWAVECDLDVASVRSNTFTMEWPRGSGRIHEFPEIDAAAWHDPAAARDRLVAGQVVFVDRLEAEVGSGNR